MEKQNKEENLKMVTEDYILGCISAIIFCSRGNISDENIKRKLHDIFNIESPSPSKEKKCKKNEINSPVVDLKEISIACKKLEINMKKSHGSSEISINEWIFKNKKSFRVYLYHYGLEESWNDKRYMWRVSAEEYDYSFNDIDLCEWTFLFKFDSMDFYHGFIKVLKGSMYEFCTVDNIYDNTSASKIYTADNFY